METVYNKIVDTFNTHPEVFTERSLPKVRHIDIHMGQPDDPEAFEVLCPAIFIDWSINPAADDTDPDVLTLDFHILQEPGAGTENYSNRLSEGLEYLELLKACKYLINKLRATNTTPLRWTGERPAITPFFKYHILSYTCSIDSYNDSIHRPTIGDGSIESINLAKGKLKKENPGIDIDTYR